MGRRSKSHTLEAAVKPQHRELLQHVGPEETRRWVRWLAPSLVALVTLAAFLPTLHNQFVNRDDDVNFLDNPHYRGLGGADLRWRWTTFDMDPSIRLTSMTLGRDYRLWGSNP